MNRRDQIRMTDGEVEKFIAGGYTLQVASINRDGTPHLVPMFYELVDGRIAFWTYRKSQKIKNLQRDPRITCALETGRTYEELRGVQINGRAELVDDPARVQSFGERLYAKYWGELNDLAKAGVTAQASKRIVAVVEPLHISSWDHTKLSGGY
jgi:PPOX class probable F420-dependent enzyme